MASAYREQWTRAEGVMVAPGLRPEAVRDHVAGRGVVARLEWYPRTAHLLSVSIAVDESGRVATTPRRRGGVVPGMSLQELAHELGETFGADVLMEGAEHTEADERAAGGGQGDERAAGGRQGDERVAGGAQADVGRADREAAASPTDERPAAAHRQEAAGPDTVEWAEHDARTVVVTPLPSHSMPLHADLLGRPLAVVDTGETRIVMTAGPGQDFGAYGWPDDAYPFLRLQVDDEDRTALLGIGPDEVAVYSWEMRSVVVHGFVDEPGPALQTMAEGVLGDRDDAEAFAAAFDADVEQVLAAMKTPSADGLSAFVAALGLPAVVVDVLEGRQGPEEVPGAAVYEPRGFTDAVSRSLGMRLTDHETPGAGFWRAYLDILEEKPWLVPAIGAAEAALGALLVGQAARGAAPRSRKQRVGAALGATLVFDAFAGLALSRFLRAGRR